MKFSTSPQQLFLSLFWYRVGGGETPDYFTKYFRLPQILDPKRAFEHSQPFRRGMGSVVTLCGDSPAAGDWGCYRSRRLIHESLSVHVGNESARQALSKLNSEWCTSFSPHSQPPPHHHHLPTYQPSFCKGGERGCSSSYVLLISQLVFFCPRQGRFLID